MRESATSSDATASATEDLLYRFRSRDALLGQYAELATQTMYLARPDEMNDPMDGLTDVFWKGDDVLWENLLRHYVMSFAWYTSSWLLHDEENFEPLQLHGHFCAEDLPTDSFRALCTEISNELLTTGPMKQASQRLAQLPVALRRRGLHTILMVVHSVVVSAVFDAFNRRGLYPQKLPSHGDPQRLGSILDAIAALRKSSDLGDYNPTDFMEVTGQIFASMNEQMRIIFMSDKERGRAGKLADLFGAFPERYLEALVRDLRHMPWRASCFSRSCTNASMWGVYAQGHRGAALVFRPKQHEGRRVLTVRGMVGTPPNGLDLGLIRVRYSDAPPPIDFFGSIGRLPRARLESNWFRGRDGRTSTRLSEITSDLGTWRSNHTAQSPAQSCWKHLDWRHEEEERLVATSPLADDPAPDALTYDFDQLEGIVFGMRMTHTDKLNICQIIERKCREQGRKHFRFFESNYLPSRGRVALSELTLLQFK